jgi:hypothetical protein
MERNPIGNFPDKTDAVKNPKLEGYLGATKIVGYQVLFRGRRGITKY